MKKLVVLTVVFIVLPCLHIEAANLNPDGYCWHPSVVLYSSWGYMELTGIEYKNNIDPRYFTPWDGKEYDNLFQGAIGVDLPASRNSTFSIGLSYAEGICKSGLGSLTVGGNFYTSKINQIEELINPDGKKNSVVISPIVGTNIYVAETYLSHYETFGGLIAGAQLSYIASNTITLQTSFAYSRLQQFQERVAMLGMRVHVNNKTFASSEHGFNPDGSPGTITVSPEIIFDPARGLSKAYAAGAEITATVTPGLSVLGLVQYAHQKLDNINDFPFVYQKSDQITIGCGVIVHF